MSSAIAQSGVEHDAFQIADNHRADVKRVTQMQVCFADAARPRPKIRHRAGQALGPVAGPKSLAFAGHALNDVGGGVRTIHWHRGIQSGK